MRGLPPILTVKDMKKAMNLLPDELPLVCMPEEGPEFHITGCIQMISTIPKQAWLIIEVPEAGSELATAHDWANHDWEGDPVNETDESCTIYVDVEPVIENPDAGDCIQPRGKIRAA